MFDSDTQPELRMPRTLAQTDISRKALLFHALSDETRLGILHRLSRPNTLRARKCASATR